MPVIEKCSVIKCPPDRLFEFFLDPNNLSKISPPGFGVSELEVEVPLKAGAEFSMRSQNGLLRFRWRGRVAQLEPPRLMVDEQLRGPFRRFRHTHQFRDAGGATLVIDRVEYTPPLGPIGALLDPIFIRPRLRRYFEYRHRRLKELFEAKGAAA
jgi:ligand-binding SRPBCC domain-containing protein